jgi:hypothetical protein
MNVRIIGLAVTTVVIAGAACASFQVMNAPLRRALIEVYRDAGNVCRTNTTPYFKVKKGRDDKVEWRIVNDTDCLVSADVMVEVKFDKGDGDSLPFCVKRNKRKIECVLREDAPEGPKKYSVWLGDQQEDPVLEIEQF